MAGARHGMCKLTARHGRGLAWAWHAMCESALRMFFFNYWVEEGQIRNLDESGGMGCIYVEGWLKPIFSLYLTCLLTHLLITYLLTYLLTPCSRVLLEKLTGSQLVLKFPAFYGTRRFITAFTRAHHLSLSWTSSIQSLTWLLCKLKFLIPMIDFVPYCY